MSQTFEHDSFFGGLNLLKRWGGSNILLRGERPPYPIIISNPTFTDVFKNFNRADFGILCAFTVLGFPISRYAIRGLAGGTEYHRRQLFNVVWTMSISLGFYFGLLNSFFRLQGFVENGLAWKRKERKLRKYDFSTDFEDRTIWKYFRLRE